jgi:SAM-dependent methyltransferase
MDGAAGWSEVAGTWSELWGGFAAPAQDAIIEHAGVVAGTRVLDVGCGSGEFLARLAERDAVVAGVDPAFEMRALARLAVPTAHVVDGDAEHLPLDDASWQVVTAVNALQFADDAEAGLAELARVTMPGGRLAIANWADAAHNDLDVIERAVASYWEDELPPDGPTRLDGGLEALLVAGGLEPVWSGLVPTPWRAADADALVRAVLMGEDADGLAEVGPVVEAAAAPFLRADGSYLLRNAFRVAVARVPVQG